MALPQSAHAGRLCVVPPPLQERGVTVREPVLRVDNRRQRLTTVDNAPADAYYRDMSHRRRVLATGAGLVAAMLFASTAPAMAYWDYQGNLPMGDGTRSYVKVTNSSSSQPILMSWTAGSHCMRFLKIFQDGTWFTADICGTNTVLCNPDYFCSVNLAVSSIYDRFGCHNPPNLGTVWVNCRATNPL